MTFKSKTFAMFCALSLLPAMSHADELADALTKYKLGAYQSMTEILEQYKAPADKLATKYYFLGIGHNRQQNYEKAALAFNQAVKFKSSAQDIWYEYGQAAYANNDLRLALAAFKKSASVNYKLSESTYYTAHISQILEDYQGAKDAYAKLIALPDTDQSLLQAARFQLGEVLLSMAESRDDASRLVKTYVLPQLIQAKDVNGQSDLATEIDSRIKEVRVRYGLDPNRLVNGRILPEKRWEIDFNQEINYDNNITLATDVPTSQATQKESYIFDSTFNAKYLASFKNKYLLEPSIRLNNKKHAESSEATVFQNDSYDMTFGGVFKVEHKMKDQPATFAIGLNHKYIARDRLQQKSKIFYARSTTFSLAETLRLNSFGDTTLRFKYKDYNAYTENLNNTTMTFAADQIIILPNGTLFIAVINADFISVEQERDSTNAFLFRVDHLRPNFISDFTLSAGLGITLLDTKEQSITRGTEKTLNPSIKLIKKLSNDLSMQITYDFTKNTSDDETRFAYTKHVTGLRFRIKF
ncbi:MAG: hypothetical protein CME71_04915 [Halobacteriovorax sp.]|nr:hypothetical protein [Halobacteriovorax sp.]